LLCFRNNFSYSGGDILLRFENPAAKLSNKIRVYDGNRKRSRLDFEYNEVRIYKYSFGYDSSNDTYKVVASCPRGKGKGTEVKVFSLGDNAWRYIQDFPVDPLYFKIRSPFVNDGIYVSGTINWLAIRNNEVYDWKSITIDQFVIISLDLGKETYRRLLPPRGFDRVPHVEPSISVLMECLCFSHNIDGKYFVIWQMKEFGVEESWTRLLKIGYSSLRYLFHQDYYCYESTQLFIFPLCLSENGNKLILAYDKDDQAILYNFRENKAEKIRIKNYIRWFLSKNHVESLVSTC
jgi:F-box interacting protein